MQPLNFGCQQRFFRAGSIQQIVHRLICFADLHDIDAVLGCWGYGNELTADVGTGPVKLMPFERRDDKDLNSLAAHTQSHQLKCKGFSCSAGSENGDIGILVDAGIEDVHDDERVVVFIDAEKNTVVIAHLIAGEGITAGGSCCQNIPLRPLIELAFQRNQRERGQKSLLLTKGTGLNIHVLRKQEFFHFRDLPFKVVHAAGCDGDKQVQIIKILIVGKTVF